MGESIPPRLIPPPTESLSSESEDEPLQSPVGIDHKIAKSLVPGLLETTVSRAQVVLVWGSPAACRQKQQNSINSNLGLVPSNQKATKPPTPSLPTPYQSSTSLFSTINRDLSRRARVSAALQNRGGRRPPSRKWRYVTAATATVAVVAFFLNPAPKFSSLEPLFTQLSANLKPLLSSPKRASLSVLGSRERESL